MKNKNWIQTIWNGICAPFVFMGMAFMGIFGFMLPEGEDDISNSDSTATHQHLMELALLLAAALLLSSGVYSLIMEGWETGIWGGGIEFIVGAIEFAGISMLLFFLVIPEMIKTLRELGYIKAQSNALGLNSIIFQIIKGSILSIMVGFSSILLVILMVMEIWEKSRTGAIAFVLAAFTLFLLAFRPTFMGMVGKFSDMKSQLKNRKKVFL